MNTTTFKSKIDAWLWVVLVISAGACFVAAMFLAAPDSLALRLNAFVLVMVGSVLPIWILTSTRYTFTATDLDVRCGPFRWRVPLRDIRTVTPTKNPLSSPALSLDRLRIDYGRNRWIMVSPRDRERFLSELEARGVAATA